MLQIERKLGRALVAPLGLDLEAAQQDLLQPWRAVGAQRARRHRVGVEPPAQATHASRVAERPLPGGEVIEHHAERVQVAARVVAHELHLLGRDVRPGAHRQLELLLEQVGQAVMARQAEVDEHRVAALPVGAASKEDVAGLHVEVHDVLAVQLVQRDGDPPADVDHLVDRQRRRIEPLAQRGPGDALHHEIRLAAAVAARDELRHVRPRQRGQDHLLDLEADDARRVVAAQHARHLHDEGQAVVLVAVDAGHAPQGGHAALVQPLLEAKAMDHAALDEAGGRHARDAGVRLVSRHRPGARRAARAARQRGSSRRLHRGRTARGGR